MQSLALTRPINPKTQEKQVLYEALRDDPQVQATRYKMDYGSSSSNAMAKRSKQIRRQMIRKMNKFKTTRADIENLLHSNGTFRPRKPKRSIYANEAAKKFYHDAKKEFEKQPTPLSHEEKDEMNGLKRKFEANARTIDELRRKVAALAGGKQRLNPTNVKHIRQRVRPKSANASTSFASRIPKVTSGLPAIKQAFSPKPSKNVLNPEEEEGQKQYEVRPHVGDPLSPSSKVQVYCTVGHYMGKIKKDFVNLGVILYFDGENSREEGIGLPRSLPRSYRPRHNNTYVVRYNDNTIEEGVVYSRLTAIESIAKKRRKDELQQELENEIEKELEWKREKEKQEAKKTPSFSKKRYKKLEKRQKEKEELFRKNQARREKERLDDKLRAREDEKEEIKKQKHKERKRMQKLQSFRESQRVQALARISNKDDPMIQKAQQFLLSKEMKQEKLRKSLDIQRQKQKQVKKTYDDITKKEEENRLAKEAKRKAKEDVENEWVNNSNKIILDKEELDKIEEATLQKQKNEAAKETLRKERKKEILKRKEETLKKNKHKELRKRGRDMKKKIAPIVSKIAKFEGSKSIQDVFDALSTSLKHSSSREEKRKLKKALQKVTAKGVQLVKRFRMLRVEAKKDNISISSLFRDKKYDDSCESAQEEDESQDKKPQTKTKSDDAKSYEQAIKIINTSTSFAEVPLDIKKQLDDTKRRENIVPAERKKNVLRQVFNIIDTDKSKKVTMEELKQIFGKGANPILIEKLNSVSSLRLLLKHAKITMVQETYIEMFGFDVPPKVKRPRDVDTESDVTDESGSEEDENQSRRFGITFPEFSKLIESIINTLKTELSTKIFNEFDEDKNGTISLDEFNAGLQSRYMKDMLKGSILESLLFPGARKMALKDLDSSKDGVVDRAEFDTFINLAFSHADHEFLVETKDGNKVICGNKMEKARVTKRMEEKKEQARKDKEKDEKLKSFQRGKSKFILDGKSSKAKIAEKKERLASAKQEMKERGRNYRKALKENVDRKLKKRSKLFASDTGSGLSGGSKVMKDAKKSFLQNNLMKALG